MRVVDPKTQEVLFSTVEIANNPWTRFKGLMLRRKFPTDYALWIEPCSSIHTMWMRVAIDAYFISPEGEIVDFREQLRPWSVALPKAKSRQVLEIVNPTLKLTVGRVVKLVESP